MGYWRDDDEYCGYYLTEEEIAALPGKTFNPEARKEYLAMRAKAGPRMDYPPWMREQTEMKEVQPELGGKMDLEPLKQRITRLERAFTNSRSLPEQDKATQKLTRPNKPRHTEIKITEE